MSQRGPLDFLRAAYNDAKTAGHGERLKRALLSVAIPASASLAIACYAAPDSSGDWIYEPTTEHCTNRLDDDYDGYVDCDDPECATREICLGCHDGIDNNSDGLTDCYDESCRFSEGCITGMCEDDADNDGDGLVDCLDPDCAGVDPCS